MQDVASHRELLVTAKTISKKSPQKVALEILKVSAADLNKTHQTLPQMLA